jgi:hypothetical protein
MRTTGPRLILVALWALAAGGCGDNVPPGLDGNKSLFDLTPREKGMLCDWGADLYGGYGETHTCADGTNAHAPPSRDQCVGEVLTVCPATVAEFEACATQIHDLCGAALFAPECAPLFCF